MFTVHEKKKEVENYLTGDNNVDYDYIIYPC